MKKLLIILPFLSLTSFASITLLVESIEADFALSLQATLTASSPQATDGTIECQQGELTCRGNYRIHNLHDDTSLQADFTEPNNNECKALSFIAKYSLEMQEKIREGQTIQTTLKLFAAEFVPKDRKVSVREIQPVNN